jgi:tetratricopeptide (TPR) repeat protein
MKNFTTQLLLIMILLVPTLYAKKEVKIDYLNLAALMFKDGNYNRAQQMLTQVDITPAKLNNDGKLEEKEPVDLIRYYTLKGMIFSKQGEYEKAISAFNNALKEGQTDKSIYLMLAQNYYKLKNYIECAKAIDDAGQLGKSKAELFSMKAECFYKTQQFEKALEALSSGIKYFEDYARFYQQRFYYLMSKSLYQSAIEDANIYFSKAKIDDKDYITFATALRKAGAIDKATIMMEKANLFYPKSSDITILLAHLYIDKEMIQAASELFDEASIEDKKYNKEAAEMYRRAKSFMQALYKNSVLLDQEAKLQQRIAIYLEFGQYERIVAMHDALKRNHLLKNEDLRYALAYSYYRIGEFSDSELELKKLTRSDLFRQATELRKNMDKCTNNPWECE